jgi:hypothetical protein
MTSSHTYRSMTSRPKDSHLPRKFDGSLRFRRCFRHQLLLGRQTHSPNRETDRAARFEERE